MSRSARRADTPKLARVVLLAEAIAVLACSRPATPLGVECASVAVIGGTAHAEYLALHPDQELAVFQIEITDRSIASVAFCSATLVTPDVALTAAHCVPSSLASVVALFGAANGAEAIRVPVEQTLLHPTLDLAQLKFATAAPESLGVKPIGIDFESDIEVSALVQIGGLGLTEFGALGIKRFAVSRVQSLGDSVFTIAADRRAGACDGDSGGPALIRNGQGRVAVAGILSSGAASCVDTDGYVRLSAARDWLESTGASTSQDLGVLANCALVGIEGRCFGASALFCEGQAAVVQACAADTSCGFSTGARGFRCIAAGADPCEGVTDLGRCDGDERLRCEGGDLTVALCAACGATCQASVSSGKAICNAVVAR
jgi:hypothetical protein